MYVCASSINSLCETKNPPQNEKAINICIVNVSLKGPHRQMWGLSADAPDRQRVTRLAFSKG